MDQPTEISALPPEMLSQILQHLSLADLVKLKSVCKLWNELISSNVKVTGLVVDTIADIRPFWRNTPFKPFDNRQMEVCHAELFFRNRHKPILSRLKYLRLNCGFTFSAKSLELSLINSFSELLRLDINYQLYGYLDVNLEKLEILQIWNNRSASVRLDCPKLRVLLYEAEGAGLLHVARPSVVELTTGMYGYELAENFENLEILKCSSEPKFLSERTLTMLPKLKRLYYDGSLFILGCWYSGLAGVRELLERFIASKNVLKRTDLQFYLGGVRLTDNLNEIDFGVRQEDGTIEIVSDEYFYIRNYDRLQDGPLEFVYEANYSSLMSATDQVPADYFDRFPNIEAITADRRVGNQEHFLWYLQNLKGKICQLTLENSALDQSFYDSLPAFCSPYNFMQISEDQELNYGFLGEFEYLENTNISQELTLESARSLVYSHAHLKEFAKLEFRLNGQHLHVHCNIIGYTRTGFTLYIDRKTAHNAERLDEIIEWIESNVFV